MELVRVNKGRGLEGKKRQYMPYELEWECPECREKNVHKFYKYDYLSYPTFGKPYEVELLCKNDCEVMTVEVVPDLKLEVRNELKASKR